MVCTSFETPAENELMSKARRQYLARRQRDQRKSFSGIAVAEFAHCKCGRPPFASPNQGVYVLSHTRVGL